MASDTTVRILLVEDSPTDARLVQELLRQSTHPRFIVTHCKRLQEAVDTFRADPTDVILLDLGLPDSKGLETLEAMRDTVAGTPIVVLTGQDARGVGVGALQAGAEEYVAKNQMDVEVLERAVRYAIERGRLRQVLREAQEREIEQAHAMASLERLKEMDAFKTGLLNHVSHELKTPLTPLKLQLFVLRQAAHGKLGEQGDRALEIIDRNIQRLQAIVRDVIDSVRVRESEIEVNPETIEVGPLVHEIVRAHQESADSRDIKIIVEEPQRVTAYADRSRLHQVLTILVENAIRYQRGGGQVIVALATDATTETATVSVADDGDGLEAAQIKTLFSPFARFHDPRGPGDKGTGLGLFVAKGIVDAHGGKITCESDGPGQGATFRVTLPISARAPRGQQHTEDPRSESEDTEHATEDPSKETDKPTVTPTVTPASAEASENGPHDPNELIVPRSANHAIPAQASPQPSPERATDGNPSGKSAHEPPQRPHVNDPRSEPDDTEQPHAAADNESTTNEGRSKTAR